MIEIILLMLVIILFETCLAQDSLDIQSDFRTKCQIGLKAGTNYSKADDINNHKFKTNSKFGFVCGGYISIPINKSIGLQPELQYSQKGFDVTKSIMGKSFQFTRTTSFIDIPLMFAIKLNQFITVAIGPQYSYLIKQKDTFSDSTSNFDMEHDKSRKSLLCFIDEVDLNMRQFIISLRSGWDLMKNIKNGSETNLQYKNVWYQITFGYTFYNN